MFVMDIEEWLSHELGEGLSSSTYSHSIVAVLDMQEYKGVHSCLIRVTQGFEVEGLPLSPVH